MAGSHSVVGSLSDSRAKGHQFDTHYSEVQPLTFGSPRAGSRKAAVSYWRKYVHLVLVERLGGVRLPRNSVIK